MNEIVVNRTHPVEQLGNVKQKTGESKESGAPDFSTILRSALEEVNQLQEGSDQQVSKIMSGEVEDVHTAMIAMQKADLSFQLLMQVRNKLVEAYREVMRMQV